MSDREANARSKERPATDSPLRGARSDAADVPAAGTAENDFDLDRMSPDTRRQGARSGDARLAGVPGVGTMQVIRDREGAMLRVEGTWRAQDEGTDAGPIEAVLAAGEPLRYEGRMDDPKHPDRERCAIEVDVTSHSVYTWDARPEDDGRRLPLYNVRPREGESLDR